MSTKLEEVFGMKPASEDVPHPMAEESGLDISAMQRTLDTADKIDMALPAITDLHTLDADMDAYAEKAMTAFTDLMDLGYNVPDKNASDIFDVAGKMMANAITAKTAKLDKKLKMIELQMRKRKLDLEEKKTNYQIAKMSAEPTEDSINGTAEEFDRNSIIQEVLSKVGAKTTDNDK